VIESHNSLEHDKLWQRESGHRQGNLQIINGGKRRYSGRISSSYTIRGTSWVNHIKKNNAMSFSVIER
jgi:hypothetical protein